LGQGKAAAPAAKPGSPLTSPKPDDRLLVRADELFRRGDVSGARLLLERSMEAGHARAAFLLAETFDPHVLSRLGALGIRGDAAKARELYDRARSLGIAQAQERIEALK
jgi:TPR repeat protein